MATFKEALTTSLTNFSKSIAKTYPKTANIVDNLLSTDSTLPLSAKQGNVLQTEIDTLNSNFHTKTIVDANYNYTNTARMIVDYKDSFENGVTLTTLVNASVKTCCIVFKDSNSSIKSTVHVYDAYTDREVVSSVSNTRIVVLYKNY